jgi:hypothetical protein
MIDHCSLELECFLSLMFALTVLYCRSIEDCICQCFGQNFSLKKKKREREDEEEYGDEDEGDVQDGFVDDGSYVDDDACD